MKKCRFLWSAHRITERQKAGKSRSIKGKQLKNSRSTASKPPVALRSSASDNLQLNNAKKARNTLFSGLFLYPKFCLDCSVLMGFERKFMGLSWSNYWWTIGANEVQFCHRRTNTYLTDLHRALAHSLKTRMGRGSFFRPKSGETNLSRR